MYSVRLKWAMMWANDQEGCSIKVSHNFWRPLILYNCGNS